MLKKTLGSSVARKVFLTTGLLSALLMTTIGYWAWFGNVTYIQDDYMTLEMGTQNSSIWHSASTLSNWLYDSQGRYQFFRFLVLNIYDHFFQDGESFIANFALHLANMTLLFFLVLRFSLPPLLAFGTVLYFGLFPSWRMMDGVNVMIAGSGLCGFLILLSMHLLITALKRKEENRKNWWFWIFASWLSYLALVFSYEVSFPLILPLFFTYLYFGGFQFAKWREFLTLPRITLFSPYVLFLLFYLFYFRMQATGSYVGTTVGVDADIFQRVYMYLAYTLPFYTTAEIHMGVQDYTALASYFAGALLLWFLMPPVFEKSSSGEKRRLFIFFLFGFSFYFAAFILFPINSWKNGSGLMYHHTYLMTLGAAPFVFGFLALLLSFFHGRVKLALYLLLFFLISPWFLLKAIETKSSYGYQQQWRTHAIMTMKESLLKQLPSPEQTDAILIKNFFHNYYNMSGLTGAFLQWYDFKKQVISGRDVFSAKNGELRYSTPLTYYFENPPFKETVANNRVEIFYLERPGGRLLPYADYIDFVHRKQLYQTSQVWDAHEKPKQNEVNALLKNSGNDRAIHITFKQSLHLKERIKNLGIELNGKEMHTGSFQKNRLSFKLEALSDNAMPRYIFLTLRSIHKKENIWNSIASITLSAKFEEGAVVVLSPLPGGVHQELKEKSKPSADMKFYPKNNDKAESAKKKKTP